VPGRGLADLVLVDTRRRIGRIAMRATTTSGQAGDECGEKDRIGFHGLDRLKEKHM
jgi:hypothetical protein